MPGIEYHWYRTKQGTYGEYKAVFRNGIKYLLFLEEADYSVIDKLNLTYVGVGNIDYVKEMR